MMASCFVCIHRRDGGLEDIHLVGRDKREFLVKVHAVFYGTECANAHLDESGRKAGGRAWAWDDWYRIPIPAGQTLTDILAQCRYAGIYDGPHWSAGGLELPAAGQTKKPGSHSENRHH